jgi:hypothetical protein
LPLHASGKRIFPSSGSNARTQSTPYEEGPPEGLSRPSHCAVIVGARSQVSGAQVSLSSAAWSLSATPTRGADQKVWRPLCRVAQARVGGGMQFEVVVVRRAPAVRISPAASPEHRRYLEGQRLTLAWSPRVMAAIPLLLSSTVIFFCLPALTAPCRHVAVTHGCPANRAHGQLVHQIVGTHLGLKAGLIGESLRVRKVFIGSPSLVTRRGKTLCITSRHVS